MSSEQKIAANRENAQKSTGPRTEAGRAAVRLNAFKHGLTSMSPVAPGEDPAEFLAFRETFFANFNPATLAEETCVDTAAVCAWRLRRVYAIEAGFYEMERSTHPGLSPAGRLAFAHFQCSKQLDALSRHESRLHRTYEKSVHELERLQSLYPADSASDTRHPAPDTCPPSEPCPLSPDPFLKKQTQTPTQPQQNTPSAPPNQDFEPLSDEERQATLNLINHIFSKVPKVA